MRKAVKFVTALAIMLCAAGCSAQKEETENSLMKDIFDKLTANAEYTEWKSYYTSTEFEEKLDGDSILISIKGDEGVNGDYTFTLDGDYIVTDADDEDYTGYSLMMDLKNAIADYYGMNNMLMSGYLAGLNNFDMDNTYFFTDDTGDKAVYKLYAAEAWKMDGLDEMYVNDAALEYTKALTEDYANGFLNSGKTYIYACGSKDSLELVIAEYGGNTDLTLKSMQNVIAKLQPTGYEAFADAYTELQEAETDEYTVVNGIPEEVASEHEIPQSEGYSYMTVIFGGNEE